VASAAAGLLFCVVVTALALWCANVILFASCIDKSRDVDSFNQGEWVVKEERAGLYVLKSLYQRGSEKPALRGFKDYFQQDKLVFFRQSSGFDVLDLSSGTLNHHDSIEDAPPEWRPWLKKWDG
jgi:hypothetical protein